MGCEERTYRARRFPRVWSSFWTRNVEVLGILVSGVMATLQKEWVRGGGRKMSRVLFDTLGQNKELKTVRSVHVDRHPSW